MRWSYDIRQDGQQSNFHGDFLVTDDLVLVSTDGQGVGHVYAFERASGAVRWKYAAGDNVPSDIVRDASTIFALTQGDELLGIDVASGALRWKFKSSGVRVGRERLASSPVADRGRIYFSGRDGIVYALDAKEGRVIWSRDVGTPYLTTPVLHEGGLYVGTAEGRVLRFDSSRGAPMGALSVGGAVAVGYRLVAQPEGILGYAAAATGGRGFVAQQLFLLAPGLDTIRWTHTSESWSTPRPYRWKDSLVVGDGEGNVIGLGPGDGAELWRLQVEGVVRGIGGRGDLLFIGTLDGRLYALALADTTFRR